MDLPAIQRDVDRFVKRNGIEAPVEVRLLDLVSEVGEVSKEVLKASDYGRGTPGRKWRRVTAPGSTARA